MAHIFSLISIYGYWVIFPLMIIEGPIITIIAAFLASLGTFNIIIVYILAVLGNVIGDIIYYAIGRLGREKFLVKYGKYIGVDAQKIEYIEAHYKKHLLKMMLIAKATEAPVLPTLIAAGIAKTNFKKFVSISILAEIPKMLIIVLIGYYFGKFYATIEIYMKHFVGIMFVIFGVVVLYFIYKKIKKNAVNKMAKDI